MTLGGGRGPNVGEQSRVSGPAASRLLRLLLALRLVPVLLLRKRPQSCDGFTSAPLQSARRPPPARAQTRVCFEVTGQQQRVGTDQMTPPLGER